MIRIFLLSFCFAVSLFSTQVLGQARQTGSQVVSPASIQSPTSESLQKLESEVADYVQKDYAVGAELLVIEKGKTLLHKSFGFSDRKDKRQWENNTLCNIRSMSKPITSAAAQILIDRKLLKLDDPVAKYLESFDNEKSKSITVRQVLTHRSGLPLTNIVFKIDQYSSLAAQADAAGKSGPKFEPGSKFWYSDIGTDVVGALVEKISGELLHEFVQREIFEPLGMTNTLYGFDASDKRLLTAASLYIGGTKKWRRYWKHDKPLYPFAWGSQTIYSTTSDYAKFLKMMMNRGRAGDRQILSEAAVDRMLEPVSRTRMMGSDINVPTGFRNLHVYYGQMMVTHRVIGKKNSKPAVIGHSGSDGTNAWAWPDRDLMILYFTQSRGGMTVLRLEEPIDRLLIHTGAKPEQIPERLRPYVGTFVANFGNFDNEEFVVGIKNGKLLLDIPSQIGYELLDPDEQGQWAFAIAPERMKVAFERNDKDQVVALKLHQRGRVFDVPRKGTEAAKKQQDKKKDGKKSGKNSDQTVQPTSAKKDGSKNSKTTPDDKLKEAWIGKLSLGVMEPVMQFRIVSKKSGETVAFFDSVTEGQTGFPATWSIKDDKLNFDVARIKLKYRGTLNKKRDTAEGTWSQGGREFPLTLKKHAKEYDTVNVWKNRPQRPVGPFPYDAEEVKFENKADEVTLAGTLTIPKKPGRHPVVVLISGSGPQDRDETLMEHKPFLVLADYLTKRGIAVLRYDDRGTAKSTGKFRPATTKDFAQDASAAVEFLKNHDRINPKQIGLAGHSEGGLIAPMVVGQRDDVAFVVLLAATGVDGVTISISQTEAMLRAAGTDEAELEMALAINRAVVGVVAKAGPGADVTKQLDQALEPVFKKIPEDEREKQSKAIRASVRSQLKRLQGNWMQFFLSYDPRPALTNIDCPVLAMIGTKDTQVLPDLNMPEIKKALEKGGNEDFKIVKLEGLNHLFQKCETGGLGEYVTIMETFNPVALKTIGDWIVDHTTPVK